VSIDWTVNIGALLGGAISGLLAVIGTYGAMLRFWHKVDLRITAAEITLERHADALTAHGDHVKRHETILIDVLQDVASIIGSLGNSPWRGEERRRAPRP